MSKTIVQPLALTGLAQTLTVTPSPEYLAKKAELLESAACVFSVKDDEEQAAAVQAAAQIKALEKEVETGRETVKRPVLEFGRDIDAKAKEYVKELVAERTRIEGLVTAFLSEKRRKLEAAQEEERKRLAKAAEETAARQREADLLAEALGTEPEPVPEPEPAPVPVALATPIPTASGGSMRSGLDFEVEDVHALYKALPFLVKLEANRQMLIAYLNGGACPDPEKVPGIRVFRKEKFTARAAAPKPLIESEPQPF